MRQEFSLYPHLSGVIMDRFRCHSNPLTQSFDPTPVLSGLYYFILQITFLYYFRCIYCGHYEFLDKVGRVCKYGSKPSHESVPMPGKVIIPPSDLKTKIIEARQYRGGIKQLSERLGVTPEAIHYHARKMGV